MLLTHHEKDDPNLEQRIDAFIDSGYVIVPIRMKTKLVCFHKVSGRFAIFLKRHNKKISIVVHPESEYISGNKYGVVSKEKYHNSNLEGFPKELHKGASEIEFGISIQFSDIALLKEFLINFENGVTLKR